MKRNSSGSSLVAVLFSIAMVSSLIGVIFTVTTTQNRTARRSVDRAAAISYGDAVLEHLYDQWRNAMVSVVDTTDRLEGLSTDKLNASMSAPTTTDLPPPQNLVLVDWAVRAASPMFAPMDSSDKRPQPENGTLSTLRIRLYYLATATVSFPGPANNNTVTVQRTFVRAGRNLFEDFLFGTQSKTELHPGAPMYVDGSVYIGGDMYTAHNDLHFMNDVTTTGTHTNNYRPNDSRNGTDPTIDDNGFDDNWDPSNPPRTGGDQRSLLDTPTGSLEQAFLDDDTSTHIDRDGNPDNNGYHEIIEPQVNAATDPLQLDPATSERFANNADYRIEVTTRKDGSGKWVTDLKIYEGASTVPLISSNEAYTAIQGALRLDTALYDKRAGDNVRAVTMDVEAIRVNYSNNKLSDTVGDGDGLVFYYQDKSGSNIPAKIYDRAGTKPPTNVTSAKARGLKLTNGAKLPKDGFTVVSPHSVYVQGDYNTGSSNPLSTPSNTASSYTPPLNKPSPVASGYTRIPSAVVGDAVNILSNAWNDANSPLARSSRVASNTTVNTAIVAGNVPTSLAKGYSGGVENFARFHENWSGKYYTIYGAIALLYASKDATNAWSNADYSPPNRRWYYDEMFKDNNPPGFRVARVYQRGLWSVSNP
ncbi:MAG: hypothetical protein M3436_17400 [Pseudomonadota bacterium]|nr:hypothetical protein [Pseudomonadota bacterium]